MPNRDLFCEERSHFLSFVPDSFFYWNINLLKLFFWEHRESKIQRKYSFRLPKCLFLPSIFSFYLTETFPFSSSIYIYQYSHSGRSGFRRYLNLCNVRMTCSIDKYDGHYANSPCLTFIVISIRRKEQITMMNQVVSRYGWQIKI